MIRKFVAYELNTAECIEDRRNHKTYLGKVSPGFMTRAWELGRLSAYVKKYWDTADEFFFRESWRQEEMLDG